MTAYPTPFEQHITGNGYVALTPEVANRVGPDILRRLNESSVLPRFARGGLIRPEPTAAFLSALEYGSDEGVSMSLGERHGGQQ